MLKIKSLGILFSFFALCIYNVTGSFCDNHNFDCQTNVFQRWSVVAAIDIGDSYTRWAYAPLHCCKKDSTLHQWEGALRFSIQDQTQILLEADGSDLRLVAFGTDAETKYLELRLEEQINVHYMKHFKAQVCDREVLSALTTILDSNEQPVNAQTAFALSIQFQKNEILSALHCSDVEYDGAKILWVVTAWNDSEVVKLFMRAAALRAGIDNGDLMIAAEADVASIYGRLILKEEFFGEADESTTLKPGTKYMVLDAGGGSVFVIANQVIEEENLKQTAKANCHHCGGSKIDELFFDMLDTLLGDDVLQNFQRACRRDHLHMLRQFEIEKKPVSSDKNIVIKIHISECLQNIVQEITGQSIQDRIAQSELKDKVWFEKGTLYTEAEWIKNDIFLGVVQKISSLVQTALDETKRNDADTTLITVGGFSNSPMLQQTIQSMFSQIETIPVKDPHLAVVKGAAIYGSNPSIITERLSVYSYGFATTGKFVEGVHDRSKKFFMNGIPHADDVFLKFVEVGQTVKIDEILFSQVYDPAIEGHLTLPIPMYECTHKSPVHVTDVGCVRFNYKTIESRGEWQVPIQRKILISVSFTGSEFLLNVTDIYNKGAVLSFTDNLTQMI